MRALGGLDSTGRPKAVTAFRRWERLTAGPGGTVIYIILGFAIALAAHAGLALALSTDTPVVAVFSNSMLPTYLCGDMIIVVGDRNVSIGDVVVFDAPGYGYPIIHRVWNITGDEIRTKGDNNTAPDPWATDRSTIHGKAVFRMPLLGWVKKAFVGLLSGGHGLRCS